MSQESYYAPTAVRFDKGEPVFTEENVNDIVIKEINDDTNGKYFTRRINNMSKDLDNAQDQINKYITSINNGIAQVVKTEQRLTESTKQVSGKVRDAYQKLNDGVLRIEKAANFDRLERMVVLLERAESAMSSLAELEKTGKLEKILNAVK